MSADKQPRRVTHHDGRVFLKPGPGDRGGVEIITDLEKAKQDADQSAHRLDQNRYVVRWAEGYVVMGYSDLWDYFGDPMKGEIVHTVNAPGTSVGKKWPGEE